MAPRYRYYSGTIVTPPGIDARHRDGRGAPQVRWAAYTTSWKRAAELLAAPTTEWIRTMGYDTASQAQQACLNGLGPDTVIVGPLDRGDTVNGTSDWIRYHAPARQQEAPTIVDPVPPVPDGHLLAVDRPPVGVDPKPCWLRVFRWSDDSVTISVGDDPSAPDAALCEDHGHTLAQLSSWQLYPLVWSDQQQSWCVEMTVTMTGHYLAPIGGKTYGPDLLDNLDPNRIAQADAANRASTWLEWPPFALDPIAKITPNPLRTWKATDQ